MLKKQLIEAIDRIADTDDDVAGVLPEIGYPESRNRPAGFETFVSTVVSQQLSTKAAATILGRVKELLPELNPDALLAVSDEALRAAGLSARKVEYVKGLATAMLDGTFDPEKLKELDDEQAVAEIVRFKRVRGLVCKNLPDVFPGSPGCVPGG